MKFHLHGLVSLAGVCADSEESAAEGDSGHARKGQPSSPVTPAAPGRPAPLVSPDAPSHCNSTGCPVLVTRPPSHGDLQALQLAAAVVALCHGRSDLPCCSPGHAPRRPASSTGPSGWSEPLCVRSAGFVGVWILLGDPVGSHPTSPVGSGTRFGQPTWCKPA